jgi:hypothetical protein
MENSICNFQVLETPNRRYANTVNLVFFKAFPPSKNFQIYVDGLKEWNRYMKKYPNSQLQVFIDQHIAADDNIVTILQSLGARIYIFQCPEYLADNGYHYGLFGTMVRFFPMFDINKHAMTSAHFQELEPTEYSVPTFAAIDYFSRAKTSVDMGVVYLITNIYRKGFDGQQFFEKNIPYPWMLAGRFCATTKVPFKLLTNYLEGIKNNVKLRGRYDTSKSDKVRIDERHGSYSFGVDETFLNAVYLPWLIENGYGVGIVIHYYLSDVFYYCKDLIVADKRSTEVMNYILQKKQNIYKSLKDIDDMFYTETYTPHVSTSRSKEVANRYYEMVEKYPNWLGHGCSKLLLNVFKGFESRVCMLVVKHNKLIEVKDMR